MTKTTTISERTVDLALNLAMGLNVRYMSFEEDIKDFIRSQGARNFNLGSGCYRTAIVLKGGVIKISQDMRRQSKLIDEAEFINRMRQNVRWGRHFPETHVVDIGNVVVLVQERVNMSHDNVTLRMVRAAERLGGRLGISDVHDENFGWKGPKGHEYPVFIDVDFRTNESSVTDSPPPRSWMI